jgi:hypothetical protein
MYSLIKLEENTIISVVSQIIFIDKKILSFNISIKYNFLLLVNIIAGMYCSNSLILNIAGVVIMNYELREIEYSLGLKRL